MDVDAETAPCPWCGETILAGARQCNHCGEYLEAAKSDVSSVDRPTVPSAPNAGPGLRCSVCGTTCPTPKALYEHRVSEHGGMNARPTPNPPEAPRPEHDPSARFEGLTTVPFIAGVATCGACGGTSFTPRRKTASKLMSAVASVTLGQAKHVECVTCGKLYKRPDDRFWAGFRQYRGRS